MNALKLGGEVIAPDSSYTASVAETLLTGIETAFDAARDNCHCAFLSAFSLSAIIAMYEYFDRSAPFVTRLTKRA
jgi:hypothetical protein